MSKTEIIQFHNCRILREGKILVEDLWTRGGKIIDPEPVFFDEKVFADIRIDCQGLLISPGFIDVQVNGNFSTEIFRSQQILTITLFTGGFGIDFSLDADQPEEGLKKVAHGLLAYGTTSFCPTLVTSPPEFYHKVLYI